MANLIALDDISIKFAGKTVLQNLTFEVKQGEHWAITGKSGTGKSVLLQILAGNIRVNSGSIVYDFAADTVTNPQQLIAFAGARHHFKNLSNTGDLYYQQRYNSSDSEDALTVHQYLSAIKTNNRSPAYWALDKTLGVLNLNQLADKQVIKLSNGETKRLMIAAALLKNPVILLLDNPLTGLDVDTRKQFDTLLSEIASSGITIIIATSSHELPEIITRVAILQNGTVAKNLTKKEFDHESNQTDLFVRVDAEALAVLFNQQTAQTLYTQIVSMKDVSVRYGEKLVLNKVNWLITPGERWALLGANGAGKSTLLSLINGDNPQAYANNIVLFDKKRGTGESIWDIKSKIGFVSPELYQYFPTDNTCLQVIESGFYDTLGLFRQSTKSKAELALNWMKALEIDQYSRMLLKSIPASAQRLCLLARALIKNPPLLIFDEPCQGLDDHQQNHFKAVIDTICSLSNVTMIYVTHYQQEIPDSVTKVLKLDKGQVV